MSNNSHEDQLDALLDTLDSDEELEKRIDAFSHARHQYDESIKIEYDHIPPVRDEKPAEEDVKTARPEAQPADHKAGTMVFSRQQLEAQDAGHTKTVVIDDSEIQQLIDEEKGPSLKRERVSSSKNKKSKKSKKTELKTAGIVAAAIGILALGGLLIFGITQLAGNLFSSSPTTEVSSAGYEKLKSWAGSYSSAMRDEITGYESIYNKLTDEQKAEINEILKTRVGQSFDEILAEAKSVDKDDAENNNTQVAEQKAALRTQIQNLKNQLASAQTELSAAQKEVDIYAQRLADAQTACSEAQTAYNTAVSSLNSLDSQINDVTAQITALQNEEGTVENQNLMSELLAQKTSLESQAAAAQSAVDVAAGTLAARESDLSNAQSAYDSVANNTAGPQATVNSLTSQIASLQSQLDALN